MNNIDTPTYRFGPRHESGILGLARAQVIAAGIGIVLALIAVLGARQPLAGLGFLALGAAIAFAPVSGRPLVTWLSPLGTQLASRKGESAPLHRHGLRFGGGIESQSSELTIRWQLPGMARMKIRPVATGIGEIGVLDVAGSHRGAALIFSLSGPRFGLTDADEQARALNTWGQLLGALARDAKDLHRLQLTERISPDDLHTQWKFLARTSATADSEASAIYRSEIESLAGTAIRHELLLTVSFGHIGRANFAQTVATECQRLCDLLEGAGFQTRPLGVSDIAQSLRSTLDPETAELVDPFLTPRSIDSPRSWRRQWGSIRTDSALHACFEAVGLPRLPVGPEWAWPLVLCDQPITRRTLALHLELARPDLAIRRAERAVVSQESDDVMRARWGFRSGARQDQAHEAALSREAELASGFADARFALLIAVSATSEEELAASCRSLISQSAQSHVELRRLYGRQSEALVASLPLGIVRFAGGWR